VHGDAEREKVGPGIEKAADELRHAILAVRAVLHPAGQRQTVGKLVSCVACNRLVGCRFAYFLPGMLRWKE
jgi:hypothetical protein